jgi:hypothetical protein
VWFVFVLGFAQSEPAGEKNMKRCNALKSKLIILLFGRRKAASYRRDVKIMDGFYGNKKPLRLKVIRRGLGADVLK